MLLAINYCRCNHAGILRVSTGNSDGLAVKIDIRIVVSGVGTRGEHNNIVVSHSTGPDCFLNIVFRYILGIEALSRAAAGIII